MRTTSMSEHGSGRSVRWIRPGTLALLLLLALPQLGCQDFMDGLLEVEAPSQVIGRTLAVPANANLLVESAIADFECALAFYVMSGGLIGDELVDTQLAAAQWDYDRRGFENALGAYGTNTCNSTGNIMGVYTPVATARWSADNALRLLEEWTDAEVANRQTLIATAAAYSGYAHLLLGEGFCSAAVDGGAELTPAQVFALAEDRFTRAITVGQQVGATDIVDMAQVGRARARINMGNGAGAAADAAQVPTTFARNARYNTLSARSGNHVYRWINRFFWSSVDPKYQDLTVEGVPDPRVPVVNSGRAGADAFTIVWHQMKYPTESSPIPFSTGVEARLIEAEVAGGATAVAIINQLRARFDLPAYSGGLDAPSVRELIIDERRRELFLTGHHIYDLIRFDLPLIPPPGTPYPLKGGVYGSTTCLLLPQVERDNNPTLKGG